MEIPKIKAPDIKGTLKNVWENKRQWAMIGVLVLGNTIAGGIVADSLGRLSALEQRINGDERIMEELVVQDVATTKALCMNTAFTAMVGGKPITYDMADQTCDEVAQQQLQYWQGVIEKVKNTDTNGN
jgi:hypothetical protein